MEESGSHQPTVGPHQGNDSPHQAASGGLQRNYSGALPRQRGGGELSGQTVHSNRSQSRERGYASHAESNRDMQQEIDELKRKLRRAKRKIASFESESSSEDTEDDTYRQRSRTPPSETFSGGQEHSNYGKKGKGTSHKGLGNEAMNKALSQVAKSPFTKRIENASLPRRFNQPTFSLYNGRTDPVEHVSHFTQKMAVHSRDEALMCKVFPSSLGPMAMRWFNGLRANSIDSFKKLTQSFGARFITCSRVPLPLGSVLSMSMRDGETLKAYSDRYWEMFYEIDGDYDDVAISTFKTGLPAEHDLRKSLTGKPVTSVRMLMDRIDKYRRIEEDQSQGKGKAKAIPQERRDPRSDRQPNNRPRRDFLGQPTSANTQAVNVVFREPVQKVLEKVRDEPFFKWPNKMAGDPNSRNQNLYCQYHQDHGHTTEDCRNLWDHLEQLVREGKLKHLLHHSSGRGGQTGTTLQGNLAPKPPLGTINVIFAAPGRTGSCPTRIMSVSQFADDEPDSKPKRAKANVPLVLSFSEADKQGTIQPHDDALVVTLRIGGYDVRRVMVDQGSAAEIMYPDLFKGLGLKPEDLSAYSSPLVSFEGKTVIPRGQIRLPVQTGLDVVEVDFIVVDAFSPYTAIMGRPWLHSLGAVSSTLHQKVKYPSGGQVLEIVGSQSMARQCLIAAIQHKSQPGASAGEENVL